MTKRKKKNNFRQFKIYLPYFFAFLLTFFIVVVGSIDKKVAEVNISLGALAANDYKISVDQLSELYVVADLSSALGLASASDVASNYVIANTMYDAGQTTSDKLEKPNIINIGTSRGVLTYTVSEGENVDTIAAKYNGVSSDQIRWSNNLKTVNVNPGTVLYIPSTSGIVYTVKSGDTIDTIVQKYGSSSPEIVALNDLEVSGIEEGMKILIKDGSLPETERPEYVPPVRTYYAYTYLGDTSVRRNITEIGYNCGLPNNGYWPGQCTNYAWFKRQDLPSMLGDASMWAVNAAARGYSVDRTPSAGAIFQTSSGWFGHVGYVEAVNPDGSIIISEMNYNGVPCRIIRSTVPANLVGNFNYIH